MKISLVWLTLVVAASPLTRATRSSISFSFANGGLGASAEFVRSGSDLIVTLTNTGTVDAMVPTDILTAVYFNVAGDPAAHANLGIGSHYERRLRNWHGHSRDAGRPRGGGRMGLSASPRAFPQRVSASLVLATVFRAPTCKDLTAPPACNSESFRPSTIC